MNGDSAQGNIVIYRIRAADRGEFGGRVRARVRILFRTLQVQVRVICLQ